MHQSDLLIAVGARFDDRVTGKLSEFCPEARVIHIDIDPTSIRKTFHAHIPIVGDVKVGAAPDERDVAVAGWQSDGDESAPRAMAQANRRVEERASADLQAGR